MEFPKVQSEAQTKLFRRLTREQSQKCDMKLEQPDIKNDGTKRPSKPLSERSIGCAFAKTTESPGGHNWLKNII